MNKFGFLAIKRYLIHIKTYISLTSKMILGKKSQGRPIFSGWGIKQPFKKDSY